MAVKTNMLIKNVVFPPEFLEEIDGWAAKLGVSRSEMVRNALHYYIAEFLIKRRYAKQQ